MRWREYTLCASIPAFAAITKDLDLFLPVQHVAGALDCLVADGFECEITDPVWLAKARRGDFFVDLITGMSNGAIWVDESWVERGSVIMAFDIPTRVLAAEETDRLQALRHPPRAL